ncbi:MAG: regulator of chromosome condensation [Labilithrix sp.]|nr:regulator of chromosome condensation [Labilithrix sp.]
MKAHRAMLVALAAIGATFALIACGDDSTSSPIDSGVPDAATDTSTPDADVPTDAGSKPDAYVEVPPPTITCTATPCALELATAGSSTCARLSDGTVKCWGGDDYGQLGRGPIDGGYDPVPMPVSGLAKVTQLSAGTDAYCATLEDGSVKCWGKNESGQLGYVDESGATSSNVPVTVGGLPKVRSAFIGDGLACAALETGDAMCWGNSSFGRIPALVDASVGAQPPTKIDLGGRVLTSIAPGRSAVVALAEDGSLLSWGKRSRPASWEVTTLGREASVDPASPAELPSPERASLLAGWGENACAASNGGALRWGGLQGFTGPVTPAPVTFGTGAKVQWVSIAEGGQFCAILNDETARCLGDNVYGQLGTGNYDRTILIPVKVSEMPAKPARVVTSAYHACAILETGAVLCWGTNTRGQLGTGDFAIHIVPAPVRLSP